MGGGRQRGCKKSKSKNRLHVLKIFFEAVKILGLGLGRMCGIKYCGLSIEIPTIYKKTFNGRRLQHPIDDCEVFMKE